MQETEGERTQLKAAAKRAEAAAETCFQEEQLRRLNASPEVERPWAVASLSISPQAAVSLPPCWALPHVINSLLKSPRVSEHEAGGSHT